MIASTFAASSAAAASAIRRALRALERERFGDDGDRQRALDAGVGCDDRRRARTRAPTQARRDEDEVRAGNGLSDPGLVFLGGPPAHLRVAA